MITIIITTYKEPKTIGKAIEAIIKQKLPEYELLVVAPDVETLNAAKEYTKKYKQIKLIKDKGKGKPAALNLALKMANGEILVFTDGDVFTGENSIPKLIEPFKDKKIGAVSGNVVSVDSKKTMLGYWAFVLTNVAHEIRMEMLKQSDKKFFCTGYLFAIRKELFPLLPEDLLSEDGYISWNVYKLRYSITYSPESKVYVKYPKTFKDWIIQKKRSAGGYNQIKQITGETLRSFGSESAGAFKLFKYVSNLKEFFWLIALFFARIYMWIVIYIDINLKKKNQKEIWKRVETTK